MAELGDLLAFGSYTDQATPSAGPLPQVPVDHLDYDYVGKCQSIPELQAILQVLKSGKEGHYPQLERHVEKKLLELLPEKTRKQIGRLRQEPTPMEITEAEQELRQWQDQINKQDSKLKMTRVTVGGGQEPESSVFEEAGPSRRRMPPVRGMSQKATVRPTSSSSAASAAPKPSETGGKGRLSGYDWAAWEKYDVDKVCAELEEEEQAVWQEGEKAKRELQAREAARRRAYLKELGDLAEKLGVAEHDEVERKVFALREKQKGNECFRAGENAEAYLYYSRSLAWDPTSAVVYGNRAVACLKLDRLEQAEADCSMALERDPNYNKARIRRGTTRYRRGKYQEAVEDFEEVQRAIGPDGDAKQRKEVSALLEKAKAKLIEVEGEAAAARHKPGPASSSSTHSSKQEAEQSDGLRTVPIQAGFGPPECPPGWSRTLLAEGTLTAPATTAAAVKEEAGEAKKPAGMRRVAIVEEEEEEEEEEDQQQLPVTPPQEEPPRSDGAVTAHDERKASGSPPPSPPPTGGGMRRVAIVEDDDDEEEGEEEQQAGEKSVPVAPPATTATTRVPIVEEEEEGQKPAQPASPQEAASALAEVVQDKATSEEEPKEVFRRVPIEDDEEDEQQPQPALSAVEEAERLKDEGNKALQAGDVRKAVGLYTASLDKHPSCAARNNRALARLKLQDWAGAEEDAAAVLTKEPTNVKALFRRGKARLGRAQASGYSPSSAVELIKAAMQDMDAVVAIEPANRPAKQERQAAQQLLTKLQQQQPAPASKPPQQQQRPTRPSSSSLLDSITGKSEAAADSSSLMKEVSSKPRAPAPVVIAETAQETVKQAEPAPTKAAFPPPPTAPASPREQPAAAQPPKKAVSVLEEQQQQQKEARTKPAVDEAAGSAAPTAPPQPVMRAVPAVRVSVPKAPPKTLYELETAWRSLRRDPPKLAQYLKLFKPATYLKVFKTSANPDVVADVFACVAEHMAEQDPAAALQVMDSLSRVGHFNMMRLMFSAVEKGSLVKAFDRLQGHTADAQALAALRAHYGV